MIKKINQKVKLLGKGIFKSKIDIEVTSTSVSAKESVEKNGGTVNLIVPLKHIKKTTEVSEV